MTSLPNGNEITLISGSQPASGCGVCGKHRRGTNESKSNGTTCYARIAGGIEICGDCGQILKALFP